MSPLFPATGGGAGLWLSVLALAGFILLGGIIGGLAETEPPAEAHLGALAGGAAVYFASLFFETGTAALWGLVLIGGALLAAAARRAGLIRPLRRVRLPRTDTLFISLVDVQLSFPSFFLILTVIALLPPSIWNIMIVIGVTGWVGPARFVRAEILSLRERAFVEAAVALGGGDFRLIFLHLMPNAMAPVLVSATIGIAGAILTEAGLSFLGFGVPPPDATWGNILSDGKKYIFDAPWLTLIPGFAILIVVLAFNLFGEGLRDALNPRAKPE
ncbi:MAG: ABC transporter permease [bacterium]